MARDVADYVALALIRNEDSDSNFFGRKSDFSGDLEELKVHAETLCGFRVSEAVLARAIRALADCALIRVTEDSYSGTFVKIKSSSFDAFINSVDVEMARAKSEDDELGLLSRPSDYPAASGLIKHELFDDYRELGSEWLTRALTGLRQSLGEEGVLEGSEPRGTEAQQLAAPASDRIVTLHHNQQAELEVVSTELISAVEKENALEGDTALRQRLLGQLKAGRELIRAQTLSAYILYQTLFSALARLIDRYKGHAVGIAAAKLLEMLIEHVFTQGS